MDWELLAASEFWFTILKWVGVTYLTLLGIALLRSARSMVPLLEPATNATDVSASAVFVRCFVVAAIDFIVMLFYAGFGTQVTKLLRSSAVTWVDRGCGSALLILAGAMAFYRRASN